MEKNIKLSSTNSIVKEVKDKYGKLSDIKGNFDLLDNFKTVEIDDIGINALFINLKPSNSKKEVYGTILPFNRIKPLKLDSDGNYEVENYLNVEFRKALYQNVANIENEDFEPNTFSIANITNNKNIIAVENVEQYVLLKAICGMSVTTSVKSVPSIISISKLPVDGIIISKSVVAEINRIDDVNTLDFSTVDNFIILKNVGICSSIKKVKLLDRLITTSVNDYNFSHKSTLKREQYVVRKINIAYCENVFTKDKKIDYLTCDKDNIMEITMSENRIFRDERFHNIVNGKKYADSFIVLSVEPDKAFLKKYENSNQRKAMRKEIDARINYVIRNGIKLEMRDGSMHLFKVAIQSAAQARTCKYYFFDVDNDYGISIKQLRKILAYSYNFTDSEGKVKIAKRESRLALAFTNTVQVLKNTPKLRFKILKDPKYTTKANVAVPNRKFVSNTVSIFEPNKYLKDLNLASNIEFKKDVDITYTPHDGQGYIEFDVMSTIAKDLGIITGYEAFNFNSYYGKNGYEGLLYLHNKEQRGEKLSAEGRQILKIVKKLPSAIQVRNAGDKGLLMMFPFRYYRSDLKDYDCVAGDNFRKFEIDDYNLCSFEIANVPKEHEEYSDFNYQFSTALNITAEELISIADDTLNDITEGIMKDPKRAIEFLGDYTADGLDETELQLNSKLDKIICANSSFLSERYVQQLLRKRVAKKLTKVMFSSFKVKGAYHYCVTDPFAFFRDCTEDDGSTTISKEDYNRLNKLILNKSFLDNKTCILGLFRSPMYSKYQACTEEVEENDSLWFLHNIIVLDSHKLTLMRLSGADCDGDKLFCCEDDRINKCICKKEDAFIPFDDKLPDLVVNDTEEEMVNYYLKTSKRSEVGAIANIISVYRDRELSECIDFNKVILAIGALEGWEIDKAKGGYEVHLPDYIRPELKPHWLVANADFRKHIGNYDFIKEFDYNSLFLKNSDDKYVCYKSNSPQGQLFDYCFNKCKEILKKVSDTSSNENFVQLLESTYGTCSAEQYEVLYRYYTDYTNELSNAFAELQDVDNKTIFNNTINTVADKYRKLLLSLDDNHLKIAVGCYRVSNYDKNGNLRKTEKSFVFNCMFDEYLKIISEVGNATKLFRLPKIITEKDIIKVGYNGMIFATCDNKDNYIGKSVDIPYGIYKPVKINSRFYIEYISKNKIEYNDIAIEDNDKLFSLKLVGFEYYGNTILDVVNKLKANKEFTVQFVNKKPKIVIDNKAISGIVSEAIVDKFVNKLLTINECGDIYYYGKDDNKKKVRKSLVITFNITGNLTSTVIDSDSIVKEDETTVSMSDDNFDIPYDYEAESYDELYDESLNSYEEYIQDSSIVKNLEIMD